MSTSAPIKREYDIPIIIIKPKREPLELPAPTPERWIPSVFPVRVEPMRVPESVPARRYV